LPRTIKRPAIGPTAEVGQARGLEMVPGERCSSKGNLTSPNVWAVTSVTYGRSLKG
jgi:hypothetical protein